MPLKLDPDIEKEREKIWKLIKSSINSQDIKALTALLGEKHQEESYTESTGSDSHDLGSYQNIGQRKEILNINYIDLEKDGSQLLMYAIESGSVKVMNHLRTLGVYPTIEMLRVDGLLQNAPPDVTYYLLSSVYDSKLGYNRVNEVTEVLELAKTRLTVKGSDQKFRDFLVDKKDKTYKEANKEILEAVKSHFEFDEKYIKGKGISDAFPNEKRLLLKSWSATADDAKGISQKYDKLNNELLKEVEKIGVLVEKNKGYFQADSRGPVLEAAAKKIESIQQAEGNPAQKFKEIMQIIIDSHNAFQTEINGSGFLNFKLPKYQSTTKDALMKVINSHAGTSFWIKHDKKSLISYQNTAPIDTDAEIFDKFLAGNVKQAKVQP